MKAIALALLSFLASPLALAGAWGAGSFENDDALDWVSECTESRGTGVVSRALDEALKDQYLEAPYGSEAIAAAEVVAAAMGKPSKSLPPELRAWIQRQPREKLAQLAQKARQVLVRVQDPKVSELRQLWDENRSAHWVDAVAELLSRLEKSSSAKD